eukprot:277620-Chlamydomonas_euryale.AAC.4
MAGRKSDLLREAATFVYGHWCLHRRCPTTTSRPPPCQQLWHGALLAPTLLHLHAQCRCSTRLFLSWLNPSGADQPLDLSIASPPINPQVSQRRMGAIVLGQTRRQACDLISPLAPILSPSSCTAMQETAYLLGTSWHTVAAYL